MKQQQYQQTQSIRGYSPATVPPNIQHNQNNLPISNQFNEEIQHRIKLKYQELGLKQPLYPQQTQILSSENGIYNFRKVFDPVRDGRPEFAMDTKYMDQLKDYKSKYLAPSRNYDLQYRNPSLNIKNHDFYFQDFYMNLYEQDKEEIFFNKYGKKFVYQE
ncbi:unnamed protein product [Paramecium octaurelia]|uniref:Uncharacterized protein n=1 Tax=Paramecium octaurelia TaxID=43137 RepID=A0A8S1Y883_PAROT|nr:unnamed protein product [Paramecium octaurelia]